MNLHTDLLQSTLATAVETALTGTRDTPVELAAIGVPAMSLTEQLGGYDLGLSADTVVHHRLGYGLEPTPTIRESVFAFDLLHPDLVPSDILATVVAGTGWVATSGSRRGPQLSVDSAGKLWGATEALPSSVLPGLLVARASQQDGTTTWYVVDPKVSDCEHRTGEVLGLPVCWLDMHGVRADACRMLSAENALERDKIRHAAVLLGLAERALESARDHVNSRRQFGRPLLDLQTVAHRLALLVAEADGWRLMLQEAAWRTDRSESIPGTSARVLAAAIEHANACARLAIQLHGVRGMAAHSIPAAIYKLTSVEMLRMDPVSALWTSAGRTMIGIATSKYEGSAPSH